jgi:hypothetical protein
VDVSLKSLTVSSTNWSNNRWLIIQEGAPLQLHCDSEFINHIESKKSCQPDVISDLKLIADDVMRGEDARTQAAKEIH